MVVGAGLFRMLLRDAVESGKLDALKREPCSLPLYAQATAITLSNAQPTYVFVTGARAVRMWQRKHVRRQTLMPRTLCAHILFAAVSVEQTIS